MYFKKTKIISACTDNYHKGLIIIPYILFFFPVVFEQWYIYLTKSGDKG